MICGLAFGYLLQGGCLGPRDRLEFFRCRQGLVKVLNQMKEYWLGIDFFGDKFSGKGKVDQFY